MRGAGRRVVVTGFGVVAPSGIGKDAFWQGLLGPAATGSNVSVIADWDPSPWFDNPKEARRADRVQQFALAAAAEAFDQLGELTADPGRKGVIFGTGVGGLHTLEEQVRVMIEKGERRVSPFLVPMMMANAAGRLDLHALRPAGAERDRLHGLCRVDARHRLRGADHRVGPRRRRRDRRRRERRDTDVDRRVLEHDGDVDERSILPVRRGTRWFRPR